MKNYIDGGEAILEAIRNLDIPYIISSPGSEWGPLWEALVRQKINKTAGPTYMDVWHETIAVNMALGYTQVTGKPLAVVLHAGLGLMQGSVGIHAALQAEAPMLVLSGEALSYGEDEKFDPGLQWYRSLNVVGGPHRLVEPIVKWASQASNVRTLYESVTRGVEMAQRTPSGPVYLNVPIENMVAEWTPPAKFRKVPPAPKVQAQMADVERIAKLLMDAKNPVVTTDSAGKDPDTFNALVELADLMAIPVVEGSYCGYANFPRSNPMYLGGNFKPFMDTSDLVLLVRSRIPWYPPSKSPRNATIVAINETPIKTYMVYQNTQADHYLEGSVAASLTMLAQALRAMGATPEKFKERRQKWAAEHAKIKTSLRDAEAKVTNGEGIDPIQLAVALRETMPADAVYVDETITHRPLMGRHLSWDQPQSYFYVNGALGQGIGVSLGVKLAAPKRPVVTLIGDGSFLYNPVVQGLGASRDQNLPLLIMVFNNKKYKAMQQNHTEYYPDGIAATSGEFYGTHINGPVYEDLGKPFGIGGRRVSKAADLKDVLKASLADVAGGKTTILNVELNR